VVFILSPEGFGLLPTALSLIILLILDIFTKILFYLEHAKS
jgi:bacteriorhodopsin